MTNFFKQLINKHLFITRVRKLSGKDCFVVFKHLVELSDGVLEDGKEVGEAEVGDLMHVGVHVHHERSHDQGNVRSGCGRGYVIMERLPLHVRRVDGLEQLPAAHGGHELVHGELQHPVDAG